MTVSIKKIVQVTPRKAVTWILVFLVWELLGLRFGPG